MSLYDKASLVQIPSGTKDGTLYSVLPANGDGDFDHTRASSATRVNKDGLIESVASGVPRLDYPLIDGVVQSCPALLLEPSRTNVFPYSEDFSQWSPTTGITVTGSQFNELTGNSDAYKIETNGSTGFLQISETVAATSGNNTYSVFAKKGTNNKVSLRGLSGVDFRVIFDLDTGTIDSELNTVSSKIEDYGSGWYRLSVVFSGANTTFYIYPSTLGTADAGNIYVYGAQLEAGTYETSYIPTSGSAVTRSADVCDGAGTSAEFNDSEGVLFVEIAAQATNLGVAGRLGISDSSSSDRVIIGFTNNDNEIQGFTSGSGSTQSSMTHTTSDLTSFNKIALKYKANDFALWINGYEVGTDTSGTAPSGLSELAFDDGAGGSDFYGNTKQLMTFNEVLTDSQLEQVTSWTSFGEMAKGQLYTIE